MSELADKLFTEFEDNCVMVRNIERAALESGRDLNPDDLAIIAKHNDRNEALTRQLEVMATNRSSELEVRKNLDLFGARISSGPPVVYRTAGELFWDFMASISNQHTTEVRDGARRYNAYLARAAEHMGTSAAATTPTAGGFGGLWVAGPVGPVLDVTHKGRPFLAMIGLKDAPNSMSFLRPRIVDASYYTGGAAQQTLEKAELVSKAFNYATDTLTLKTYGGYLNLSQQAISFIPQALDAVINQLSERVAQVTETAALTELALTAAKVTLAAGAASDVVLAALVDAAKLVYDNTGSMPTWLVAGPAGWAMLAKLTDAAKRPIFPALGPANALGTSTLANMELGSIGINWTVTHGISDTKMYMGNEKSIEAYGYRFPVMEAVEPSVLGRQIAVAEADAFFRPVTNESGPARNGAVLIGP